jgi:chromosome segregation protein
MQLQSIDDRLEKLASVKQEHQKELEQLKQKKQEFKKTTLELNKTLSQSSDYAAQLANARSKSISKQEELARLEARQSNIIERLAGGTALRHILDLRKKEKGIYGTVAELGNVSKEHSQALEIAAGNKVKSVVVTDDAVAAKCIQFLKDKKLGVATFLPLNKIRTPTINENLRNIKSPGVKGLAVDLISFKQQYKKVFEYVFGNTLVVDSIETARRVGIGRVRMSTLTGDIAERSGAMQGGHRNKRQGLGFQEKETSEQLTRLDKQINDLYDFSKEIRKHREKEVDTMLVCNDKPFEVNLFDYSKALKKGIDVDEVIYSENPKQYINEFNNENKFVKQLQKVFVR